MTRSFIRYGFVLLICFFISCKNEPEKKVETIVESQILEKETAQAVMQKHLDAVSNRDLKTLESTLSPDGNMQLILPGTEIIEGKSGFMDYHREWFKAPDWTIDSKILNSQVGGTLAMIIVESIYREPERDGKPYFNRMTISYDLKKIDENWYVIKDHMASVQKSTDENEAN